MTGREGINHPGQDAAGEKNGRSRPRSFGYFLLPGFSQMAFTSALEPLRAANRQAGRRLYQWCLVSLDGKAVTASNGVTLLVDHGVEQRPELDDIVVCAGEQAHLYNDKSTLGWLRREARRGTRIGAVSTGTYVLARAGLLQGHRCTIHWENLAGFAEAYPDIELTPELFEIDGSRFTCSGGTAALDMMLAIIGQEHGRDLATAIAENFIHERIRDRHDHQRMTLRSRLNVSHPRLLQVVDLMERHLEEPLARSDLARRTGMSTRQLERLFRRYLGRTPTRFYLELRLERARHLLAQTSLSVLDVALACGFVSASHFSKCYREHFDRTPREERIPTVSSPSPPPP